MTNGWRGVSRALRERGQSEVLGATLLTGIMVILVATGGLFLFADFDDDEEQLLANIEGDVTATNITLTHNGGDTFPSDEVTVIVTGDNVRELGLAGEFDSVEGDNGELAPGDAWEYDTSGNLLLGDGRILVVHEPTNTVLLDDAYSVQVVPGGIDLRVESFSSPDRQSNQADIWGEGDSSSGDDGELWSYNAFVDFNDDGQVVKNPNELNITFDPETQSLSHSPGKDSLEAFDPNDSPEQITVTASVEGFTQEDEVDVSVYPLASLDLTVNDVGPPSSSSNVAGTTTGVDTLSVGPSTAAATTSALQGSISVELPVGSDLAVNFTAKNNEQAPAIDETVSLTSSRFSDSDSTTFSRVDPGESRTDTLELDIPDDFTGSTDVTLTLGGVTKSITLTVVEGTFEATSLVPNAKQQQTFRFSLSDKLLGNESVTITLPKPPADSVLGYEGTPQVASALGSVTESVDDSDKVEFTYEPDVALPPQTPVEIRVPQVTVGSADEPGPYKYSLERSDDPSFSRSTNARVSRETGTPGLKNVDASDLTGTSTQKLTLTFEPTLSPEQIGKPETVAIDLTDGLDSLDLSNVNVDVDNAAIQNKDIDEDPKVGSWLTLKLGSAYSGGPVEVNLTGLKPEAERNFEVGFSRGANDTVSATVDIEAQKPSAFESVSLTDIVPNSKDQDQILSLTLDSSLSPGELPGGETVNFNIDGHRLDERSKIYYGNAEASEITDDDADDGEINGNNALGQGIGSFSLPDNVSPGQTFKIRLGSVVAGSLASQTGPYDVTVSAGDRLTTTETTFDVSRDGQPAAAGLRSFSVENLAGTEKQTQNITFEPKGPLDNNEIVAIELNDAYVEGGVSSDSGFTLRSGQGQLSDSNTGGSPVYVTYNPADGETGEITIEVAGVNPDTLDKTYSVGISRGTAGTAGATFGAFAPAQFEVTLDTDGAFQGTYYGSDDSGLSVTAEVENTDDYLDTQTVTLDVGGTTAETDITLGGGESKSVTLTVDSPSTGSYDNATVSSETDSASFTAEILGRSYDLIAGFEKNGTDGNSLTLDLNVVSFDGKGGDTFGSYSILLSYDDSVLSLDESGISAVAWDNPFDKNTDPNNGVSVVAFSTGGQTPAAPALTFDFDIDSQGESVDIEFNDSVTNGENEITKADATRYDVLFLNGTFGT